MATAPTKQSDEQNTSSTKPRRTVLRSLSWKRPTKRTKMEDFENEKEPGFDATVGDEVDVGRSFDATASSSRAMSDEDAEDEIFEHGNTASSSKKRKKIGVWKAVKRFFSRKSDKGSKSFTSGYSRSHHGQPQRSVSDPNLAHRTGERPQVAPLEQVDETQMETKVSPKKAISHDSLLSELRSTQGKKVGEESQKILVIPEHSDVDWQLSPTSTSQQLLPGLNVSRDKIRVAPRHRRAPTRKGAASARHAGRYVQEDDMIPPRSKSVGVRVQGTILQKEPQLPPNEREIRVRQEEIENQRIKKQIEEEQRKPEQEEVERKKQEAEKEEDEREKLVKEEHERERLEQQKCEQEKLEQERLAKQKKLVETEVDHEKLENQRLEQEKLERLKLEQEKLERENLQQEKLEIERLKHEKLEREKIEQEKLEREKLEKNLEWENLERLRLEQEKIAREKVEQEEIEKQILEEEKRKAEKEKVDVETLHEEDSNELNQYHLQQTTDFSDLVESLRPSGDHTETYREETTEIEINEIISLQKPETSGDNETSTTGTTVTSAERSINIVEQDVTTSEVNAAKEQSTPAMLDIEINDSSDDQRTEDYVQTNNLVVSSLETIENSSASAIQEIREPAETKVVELVTEQSEESQSVSVSVKEGVHTQDTNIEVSMGSEAMQLSADESQVNTDVSVKETTASLGSSPPVTPNSPIRSRRLVIETPEKVYEKPFMEKVRAEEARANEKSDEIQHEQPLSTHRLASEEKKSQDDSNIGVAKLTQAFERSSRSYTISYGERRKKPDVFPKPKVASKPQSQTLERNYRFPFSANKPDETESSGKKSPRKPSDDVVVVLGEVPEKIVETKTSVSSSPTKKVVPPKPKLLPKPVPKPKVKTNKPNVATKTAGEGKENVMKTSSAQSVTNGSIKMAGTQHSEDTSKDTPSDLPSFWARRNIFSPEQKTSNSTPTPNMSEKTKEAPKHTPFIQLKTDNCAVCGSKVYQMEKFKVKDNIVHRSCIKCSVCKRLLSVGNFIMSQNKIYCKPHEPPIAISLTTV